jgi:hypothetical protein
MDSSPPTDRPRFVVLGTPYGPRHYWLREHFVGAWRGGGKTALLSELHKRALRRARGPARVLPFRPRT